MADATPKRRHMASSTDGSPVDRISNLPESIISEILSSIPTKEAVATSILSRSWRFRWTKVKNFYFEHFGKGRIRREDAVQTMDFVDFINMVLLNHNGESINKFVLRFDAENSPHIRPLCLNMWANVAISQHVRVLVLDSRRGRYWVSRENYEFHLPSSLYTSGTLEILRLSGRFRVKSPNQVCLTKLAELVLNDVVYESCESFHKLIAGCPVLKSLEIVRTNVMDDNLVVCNISSPVLKYLHISFCSRGLPVNGDSKLSIDAPALEELSLYDHLSSYISIQPRLTNVKKVKFNLHWSAGHSMMTELFQAFSSVKFLSIEWPAIEEETLPITVSFKRLVRLVIYSHYRPQSSCLMRFLGGCINLEELELSCVESDGEDPWRNPACVPKCLLSSLRYLTLAGFDTGLKSEMTMLKYFLANGLKMERVCLRIRMSGAKRLRMLTKVSKLSRVSSTCKILLG